MMFKQIFIEKECIDSDYTQNILKRFKNTPLLTIDKIEDVWGRVKKPYLQKRDNLSLFIGKKRGDLVRLAPDAYGVSGELHFYFIHAYNCIYECEYCYLQGYFNTPDIVLFINHDEIIQEMEKIVNQNPTKSLWFHAGEFSDSLALSHLTNEWHLYWDFFKKYPNAKLEIRTKSVNIKSIENLPPLKNVFISFTIAPENAAKDYDKKCPSTNHRLQAIEKLAQKGHQIGLHFDPIIYDDDTFSGYQTLIERLKDVLPEEQLAYLSIGVVRFTKESFREVENNYPKSKLLASDFTKSFDGKYRYNRPMRMWILNKIKSIAIDHGIHADKIYLCMEDEEEVTTLSGTTEDIQSL